MTWTNIKELRSLSTCPWCRNNELEYTELTNRFIVTCNCGCKIYECKDLIWYRVPEKEKNVEVNMKGYYEQKV